MSILPRDPDEQLRLGLRIIESAYDEKTKHQEHELQQLRAHGKERQQQVSLLERRVAELEAQVSESDNRARVLADEKTSLQQQLKETQRELNKLDSFKRSIIQSIKDEDLPGAIAAGGASGAFGGGLAAYGAEYTPGVPSSYVPASPACGFSSSPAQPPPSVSMAAPTVTVAFGASSPAPPESAAARMDGKDFFRQARLRLTYEQVSRRLSIPRPLSNHLGCHQRGLPATNPDVRGSRSSISSSPTSSASTTMRSHATRRYAWRRRYSARTTRTFSPASRRCSASTASRSQEHRLPAGLALRLGSCAAQQYTHGRNWMHCDSFCCWQGLRA